MNEKTLSTVVGMLYDLKDTGPGKKVMKVAEHGIKAAGASTVGLAGIGVGGIVEGLGAVSAGSAITGVGCAVTNTAIVAAEAIPVVGTSIASGIGVASSTIYTAAIAAAPVVGVIAAGTAVVAGIGWLAGKVFRK